MEEASWRRHHGGGIMEEASWRRHHGVGIMEEASGVPCGRHLEASGASGRHLRGIWEGSGSIKRHLRGIWGASERHHHLRFSPLVWRKPGCRFCQRLRASYLTPLSTNMHPLPTLWDPLGTIPARSPTNPQTNHFLGSRFRVNFRANCLLFFYAS